MCLVIWLLTFIVFFYLIELKSDSAEMQLKNKALENREERFIISYFATPYEDGTIADLLFKKDDDSRRKLVEVTDSILYKYFYDKKACYKIIFNNGFKAIENSCKNPVIADKPLLDEKIILPMPEGGIVEVNILVEGYGGDLR